MKFLKLKLYEYPTLLEEVNHITLLFKQLSDDIERTNNSNTIRQFLELQNEVASRIKEIRVFTERFSFDSRVSHFLKANKTLTKLLNNYSIRSFPLDEEVDSSDYKNNIQQIPQIMSKNSNIRSSSAITKKDKTRMSSNNSLLVNNNKSILKSNSQEKHYYQNEPSGFVHKNNPKFGDKLELIGEKSELSYGKNMINSNNNSNSNLKNNNVSVNAKLNQAQFNNDDFSQWKEIVFKIKLTPEEYNLLLIEKQNRKNNPNITNINNHVINNNNYNSNNKNTTSVNNNISSNINKNSNNKNLVLSNIGMNNKSNTNVNSYKNK